MALCPLGCVLLAALASLAASSAPALTPRPLADGQQLRPPTSTPPPPTAATSAGSEDDEKDGGGGGRKRGQQQDEEEQPGDDPPGLLHTLTTQVSDGDSRRHRDAGLTR